jgi:hypothetical protein
LLGQTAAEATLVAGDFEDFGGDAAQAAADWKWASLVLAQAAPAAIATDRTLTILRQARYRLGSLHPPTGPLVPGGAVRVRSPSKVARAPVDYRW